MVRNILAKPHETARTAVTILTFVLVLLAVAFCWSRDDVDPDLWGHVRFGRDHAAAGLPVHTTYSYTAADQPWINHELAAEWLFAAIDAATGSFGLLALKLVLGIAVVGFWLARHRRDGVREVISFGTTLLCAWGLAHYWSVRPQIFSYFCFALVLVLLGHAFQRWEGRLRWRWPRPPADSFNVSVSPYPYQSGPMRVLWSAPLLFAVWSHLHGGFLAGIAVYVLYLLGRSVEAWWLRGPYAYGHIRRFLLMALAASFATAVQPYGLKLHWWLWQSLSVPRPEITEWHPPEFLSTHGAALSAALLLFVLAALLSRRPRDLVQWTLLTILACQALAHARHTPFFLIAFAFWMPPHLQSCWRQLASRFPAKPRTEVHSWGSAAVLAVGCLVLATALWPKLGPIRVDRQHYPVSAVEYLAARGWSGRIVVTYNWAQYVVAALGAKDASSPGLQVSFDGRFRTAYRQEQVDAHFDFILGQVTGLRYRASDSPPYDPTRTLKQGYPDLVLISRGQPHSVRVMESQSEFVLLYQDEVAQLWGRKNRFDDPASPDYVAPRDRSVSNSPQWGAVAWPAVPHVASPQSTARLPSSGYFPRRTAL